VPFSSSTGQAMGESRLTSRRQEGPLSVDFAVRDRVATITLNRPEAMNALDPESRAALAECWRRVSDDDAIRVSILTGSGDRAFCTGADLKKTMPPKESFAQLTFGVEDASEAFFGSDKPIICAINGYALGGGLELALACDIRIAAENARFGQPEVRVGSIPGGGGTQRLPRAVGLSDAMLMLLTGDMIDSAEALRIGLVSRVVPLAKLLDEAHTIAIRIAANAPLAVRAVKRLALQGAHLPLADSIRVERMTWGLLRDTEDRIEGRLAFQQKRPPVFRGR
jgi:E-phenylitaconyl-CoA hydratase